MRREILLIVLLTTTPVVRAVDQNNNQQSDVWEMLFQSPSLPAGGDFDADGWSNAAESSAGTHPLDAASFPAMAMNFAAGLPQFSWQSLRGKRYALLASADLTSFAPTGDVALGSGGAMGFQLPQADAREFFRMQISDVDSDGDGVNEWEELTLGFDPGRVRTDRFSQTDSQRVIPGLTAANTITVAVYDDTCSERWPDPAVRVLRRSGGLQSLTVNFSLSGTATRGVDYQPSLAGNTATFALGQRELFVEISPLADADEAEASETIILTALAGSGYTVGAATTATATIHNATAASGPSAKAAARFLVQAAFGPDQDTADADEIPENVETVMAQGFSAWLDGQFAIPPQYHEPFVANVGSIPAMYLDPKMVSWWNRALATVAIYLGDPAAEYDPVRQRIAYCLNQVFVMSDRPETLGVEYWGMSNSYDMLVRNSLGNFRDLLSAWPPTRSWASA